MTTTTLWLLLLASCFCLGLSCDTVRYGNSCVLRLSSRAQYIVFSRSFGSEEQILWTRDDLSPQKDSRRKLVGSFFKMYNLTQKDSGHYKVLDKDRYLLSSEDVKVSEHRKFIETFDDESFEFTFNLEPSSCNINFTEYGGRSRAVVVGGQLHRDSRASNCKGLQLLKPCGLLNENVQGSCGGNFWVKDADDNLALAVSLTINPPRPEPDDDNYFFYILDLPFGVLFIILGIVTGCCTCLVYFTKKSSNKPASEPPDAEPVAHYREYEGEPPGARREPLSVPAGAPTSALAHVPASVPASTPACAPTEPLIHKPPATSEPAAYPEVSPRADQADVPVAPSHPEPEYRFEVKGLTFHSASPLSSDPPCSDVYTSDKLNFL